MINDQGRKMVYFVKTIERIFTNISNSHSGIHDQE